MLEFSYPYNWPGFFLPLAAAALLALSYRKKERIMAQLAMVFAIRWKILRTALLFLGLGLMAFSLLGPKVFSGYAEKGKTGMDIYILMDTSKSMLASDVAPDRLSVAKKIAESLLDHLDGDRVGFIPFASDAYIQMPLTDDYQLARLFLNVMDTDMISGGGTNLAAAIRLANDSFSRASGADRAILILSDGEENDGASQNLLRNIKDGSPRIYTIGIGTERGSLIPVFGSDGATVVDYMRDAGGNPVTSRLDADLLARLARESGGASYLISGQTMDLSPLLDDLSGMHRDVRAREQVRQFRQLYQYFLGPGILLFLLAWFLPERKVTV